MNSTESQEILTALLERAEGEPSRFRYIESWLDYLYCLDFKKSTKVVIKVLTETSNKLFKAYCQDVIAGISDVTKLLAYDQLLGIADFYENEIITVQKMLDDYDEYLGNFGNFIHALFGERREE